MLARARAGIGMVISIAVIMRVARGDIEDRQYDVEHREDLCPLQLGQSDHLEIYPVMFKEVIGVGILESKMEPHGWKIRRCSLTAHVGWC